MNLWTRQAHSSCAHDFCDQIEPFRLQQAQKLSLGADTLAGDGSLSRSGPYAARDQTKGKLRWSRLSSLLRRQLDRIVHPRLTESLVEVADIPVGAGEACPFRVGIRAGARARPLHGGARAAA